MPSRSAWKFYLKLSLVTCPVAMSPATSERNRIRFHVMNRATGNRVESRYVDAETGKPVDDDETAKAYRTGTDTYLVLEDDELDALALESTRTIEIEKFVPADSIGWVWYEKPYFLSPDDPVGEEAFAVIRAAMTKTGTVGISRLVLQRRERAVMLEPRGGGIILWTLRHGDEVRDPAQVFAAIDASAPEARLVSLVSRLIEKRTAAWDPALFTDPVEQRLSAIIAAKQRGRRTREPKKNSRPPSPTNVVSIMDALRRSLAAKDGAGR